MRSNPFTRRTTAYKLEVLTQDSQRVRRLSAECPASVEGSGVSPQAVYIKFRVADDAQAREIAEQLVGPGDRWLLMSGYGINHRVLEDHSRPAGCFCQRMSEPSGCLTCTCPDCGGVGRFGAPVAHSASCA